MTVARCDLDHQIPYGDGGSTCPCNIRPLCRAHHLAKTFTGWSYAAATPDGTVAWTSPLGLRYVDLPDDPTAAMVLDADGPPSDEPPF